LVVALILESNQHAGLLTERTHWSCPPFESRPSVIFGWVEEQIQEGEGFLEGQQCYKDWASNLRVFNAIFRDNTKSKLVTNELKYDIRKFCETLAQVREIAGYASDYPGFKKMAEMLTKVSKAVYHESDFPFQILKVLQYASVMGIGYLWPKVRADEYGYGERKMEFDALGLLDVVPVQIPPRSNNVQDAYAVTAYDYMPIAEASSRFPLFQGDIQTVGPRNFSTRLQARRLDFAERTRYGQQGRSFGDLYAEIRWTFVRDTRINTTGVELPMGDMGTTWFYNVPYVGQQIVGGVERGRPFYRTATAEDCRVYPNLRCIITSSGMDKPMYDGPAFDWDSKMPIIQYTVDDWAWEPLGRSLVGDVSSIETTTRKIERKMDAVITVTLNPPMGYNNMETGGPKIEHFDIFEEDVRIGVDGKPRETLQSVLPDTVRVESEHFNFLKYLKEAKEHQLGLQDLGNLQNMKMNIANDTADKMLESIGPIAKGIAARIERSNKAVGFRMKFLILQWFNVRRIMEYIAPEDVAPEVFDFNPDNLVPGHMPNEMLGDGQFPIVPSLYPQLDRARWFARNIRLISVPSTLLKITQMQRQLMMLQLKRGGAPISWLTVFQNMDIANPEKEIESSFKEDAKLQEMKIMEQIAIMQKLKEMGIDPQALMGGGGEGGGGGKGGGKGGGGGGQGKGGGRPSTAQRAPRLGAKGGAGGEPRTVVKES
jgi:hypothetical protein